MLVVFWLGQRENLDKRSKNRKVPNRRQCRRRRKKKVPPVDSHQSVSALLARGIGLKPSYRPLSTFTFLEPKCSLGGRGVKKQHTITQTEDLTRHGAVGPANF